MAVSNFENATLNLVIEDTAGIVTTASLKQTDSSSSGLIKSASITLNNDQIISLPTKPVQLIASPGAGKMLKFFSARMFLDATAGAYSGFDQNCEIDIAIAALNTSQYVEADNGAFADDTAVHVLDYYDGARNVTKFASVWYGDVGDLADQGMFLRTFNQTLNFDGGNAANTLKIIVWYTVLTVP